MINRKIFFDTVRETLFGGSLSESQVAGMDALLDLWALYSWREGAAGLLREGDALDLRLLAYLFATTYHEVGTRMVPVREGFARFDDDARNVVSGRSYGVEDSESGEVYYGRGTVQLTHRENFQTMGDMLGGVDLVGAPDIALGHHAALLIQFAGMMRGSFTGKKLTDYINEDGCDYYNARRVVNGVDKAELIAGYAEKFEAALLDASA